MQVVVAWWLLVGVMLRMQMNVVSGVEVCDNMNEKGEEFEKYIEKHLLTKAENKQRLAEALGEGKVDYLELLISLKGQDMKYVEEETKKVKLAENQSLLERYIENHVTENKVREEFRKIAEKYMERDMEFVQKILNDMTRERKAQYEKLLEGFTQYHIDSQTTSITELMGKLWLQSGKEIAEPFRGTFGKEKLLVEHNAELQKKMEEVSLGKKAREEEGLRKFMEKDVEHHKIFLENYIKQVVDRGKDTQKYDVILEDYLRMRAEFVEEFLVMIDPENKDAHLTRLKTFLQKRVEELHNFILVHFAKFRAHWMSNEKQWALVAHEDASFQIPIKPLSQVQWLQMHQILDAKSIEGKSFNQIKEMVIKKPGANIIDFVAI